MSMYQPEPMPAAGPRARVERALYRRKRETENVRRKRREARTSGGAAREAVWVPAVGWGGRSAFGRDVRAMIVGG